MGRHIGLRLVGQDLQPSRIVGIRVFTCQRAEDGLVLPIGIAHYGLLRKPRAQLGQTHPSPPFDRSFGDFTLNSPTQDV